MADKRENFPLFTSRQIAEAGFILLLFALSVHLLTSAPGEPWRMMVSMALILVLFSVGNHHRRLGQSRLWLAIGGFLVGFWLFIAFCNVGYTRWPLAGAASLSGYLALFISHVVLAVTVLTPCLWTAGEKLVRQSLHWGRWGDRGKIQLCCLVAAAAAVWIWAAAEVIQTNPLPDSSWGLLVLAALGKAILTGGGEELAYRGVIQNAAVERLGLPAGVVLQALLYSAFHIHLGPAFFNQAGFLLGVLALGLLFGWISRLTGGIGWAATVHIGISVVIEWRNLSLIS